MPLATRRDVVIVGGGILGLMAALRFSEEGRSVTVFVARQRDPRADSQRNHAWLQSGLLYQAGDIVSARRMFLAGSEMLEHVGFDRPRVRGVFRFATGEPARQFVDHAESLRLAGQIRELSQTEARLALGDFFVPGCIHFEVPDAPFLESQLMEEARAQAQALGATFREDNVTLRLEDLAAEGSLVCTSSEVIEPRIAAICAGAGTPRLLGQLGLEHPLEINQSVLLRFEGCRGMVAPLLADRSTGLTVVRWGPGEIPGETPDRGCLVVGGAGRRPVSVEGGAIDRTASEEEIAAIVATLPPNLRSRDFKTTAGHKTDMRTPSGLAVEPWIHVFPEFPRLIFATPGKATMALDTAERIVQLAKQSESTSAGGSLGGDAGSSGSRSDGSLPEEIAVPPPGIEWIEPIHSAFSIQHWNLDDRE